MTAKKTTSDKGEKNIQKIEVEMEKLQTALEKEKEEKLRVLADMENKKKRLEKDLEQQKKFAVSHFAKDILSVADNLGRVLETAAKTNEGAIQDFHKDASALFKTFLDGVKITGKELKNYLEKHGVQKIETIGKKFDPAFHKVVDEIEDASKEAGTVVKELQSGYKMFDKVLREALVVVTKKPKAKK